MKLCISALGPTIAEQAKAQGYAINMPTERLDRLEHAIHLLRITGMLTEAESDRAFKRLLKDVATKEQA
jgi:hypothetical protein